MLSLMWKKHTMERFIVQVVGRKGGKKKEVAALFALFLGGFGAHKFYLGHVGMGVIYFVLFWTFIPTVISFIEFVLLLCIPNDVFSRKYNKTNRKHK